MRRSRILLIFALIITIVYIIVDKIYEYKGESIKTLVESSGILSDNIKLNTGEEKYSTKVYLNSGDDNLNAVIELEVISNVEYDREKKRYILDKPQININPVGCTLIESNGKNITDNNISGYYRFLTGENKRFIGNMQVSTARELIKNNKISDVEINNPLNSGIDSVEMLEKSRLDSKELSLSYKTTGEKADIWYEISFFLDEDKNGYFKIF